MRTLLIAVAMLSVPLGLFSHELLRLRHHRAVVARCTGSGTRFVYDYEFGGSSAGARPSLATRLLRSWFGDDVFAEVKEVQWDYTYRALDGEAIEMAAGGLPEVREMSFVGPPTYSGRAPMPWESALPEEVAHDYAERQATGFGRLAGCKLLTRMVLYGGFATDQHLIRLADGGNLQSLDVLRAQNVSDDGAQAITAYKHLEHLCISEVPNVTDVGTAHLERLAALKSLDLSGTGITDVTLEQVAQLRDLASLAVHQCAITNDGLRFLSNMRSLRQLDVSNTKITDAGLLAIAALPELQELDLSGTQITDAGLEALRGLSQVATLGLRGSFMDDGWMKLATRACPCLLFLFVSPFLCRWRRWGSFFVFFWWFFDFLMLLWGGGLFFLRGGWEGDAALGVHSLKCRGGVKTIPPRRRILRQRGRPCLCRPR